VLTIDSYLCETHSEFDVMFEMYDEELRGFVLVVSYTECNRRNGPDFGRVFLMLNYTQKPQNTYIQS